LREINFLGLVVLITAVETVDNSIRPQDPAVKPCSWTVGGEVLNRLWMGITFFGFRPVHSWLKGFKPIKRGCPLNCPQAYPHAPVNKVGEQGVRNRAAAV
jgi:hypothetical protein